MNFNRTARVGTAAAFLLVSFAVQAANRLEGEWRAASCRLLSNLNQSCDLRSNSKIIFGSDNIQFLISGTLDRRDDGVRYVDVGNRTDVYVGNQKQATHVFENLNRMYIDSPTQRFFFERLSVVQPAVSTPTSASSVPYGVWQASHCEYYKEGTLLPSRPCTLKAAMKIAILPDKFVLETEGKPPRVSTEPGYKEFPRWVEVQTGGSSDRIYTDEKDFISVITKTPSADVNAKLYFTKVESVAAPVQPEKSQPLLAVAAPGAKQDGGVTTQERVQLLKSIGLVLRGKQWQNECDRPVEPKLEVVDLNGDGQSEVFALVEDSMCYGMAGSKLVLFIKDRQGVWQSNLDFPAGGYTQLKNRRGGFPDISINSPGPCAPVWGWNGSQYDLVKKCAR